MSCQSIVRYAEWLITPEHVKDDDDLYAIRVGAATNLACLVLTWLIVILVIIYIVVGAIEDVSIGLFIIALGPPGIGYVVSYYLLVKTRYTLVAYLITLGVTVNAVVIFPVLQMIFAADATDSSMYSFDSLIITVVFADQVFSYNAANWIRLAHVVTGGFLTIFVPIIAPEADFGILFGSMILLIILASQSWGAAYGRKSYRQSILALLKHNSNLLAASSEGIALCFGQAELSDSTCSLSEVYVSHRNDMFAEMFGLDTMSDSMNGERVCAGDLLVNLRTVFHRAGKEGTSSVHDGPAIGAGAALNEVVVNIAESDVYELEGEGVAPDGTHFPVEVIVRNYEADGKSVCALACRDQSETRRLIAAAAKQRVTTDMNERQAEFIANVSHEMRTPLQSIILAAEALDALDMSPQVRRNTGVMMTASRSILFLVNQILDISAIEAGKITLERLAFSIDAVVEDAVSEQHRRAVDKGIQIVYRVDPRLCGLALTGDPNRLLQIIRNLSNNAVKFTTTGAVGIFVDLLTADETSYEVEGRVIDTGIGIPEPDVAKIFDRFHQTEASHARAHAGIGLGLAIVSGIVTCMGGTIGLTSVLGEGTTFRFTAKFARNTELSSDTMSFHNDQNARTAFERSIMARGGSQADSSGDLGGHSHSSPFGSSTVSCIVYNPVSFVASAFEARLEAANVVVHASATSIRTLKRRVSSTASVNCLFAVGAPLQDVIEVADLAASVGASLAVASSQARVPGVVDSGATIIPVDDPPLEEDIRRLCVRLRSPYALSATSSSEEFSIVNSSSVSGDGFSSDDAGDYGCSSDGTPGANGTPGSGGHASTTRSTKTSGSDKANRILLAEDNAVNAILVRAILEGANYEVLLAVTGTDVVKMYQTAPSNYSAILMDVQMPELDGIAATQQIRAFEAAHGIRHPIPIVGVTGSTSTVRDEAVRKGMNFVITKPYESSELLKRVSHAVEGKKAAKSEWEGRIRANAHTKKVTRTATAAGAALLHHRKF